MAKKNSPKGKKKNTTNQPTQRARKTKQSKVVKPGSCLTIKRCQQLPNAHLQAVVAKQGAGWQNAQRVLSMRQAMAQRHKELK